MRFYLSLFFIICLSFTLKADVVTVNNTLNVGPGSLRNTIFEASAGDTIQFNSLLLNDASDSIVLLSAISIDKSLVIKGLYSSNDTLFLSGGNASGVFQISGNSTVYLDSLVIINGNADNGGGIYCSSADSLFISNSTVHDNNALQGGGIFYSSYLKLYNSEIHNNYADWGGGLRSVTQESLLDLVSSTVSYNSAGYSGGGGMWIYSLRASDSHIIENSTTNNGGGIHVSTYFSTIEMDNCVISNNTASDGGGIFHSYASSVSLSNCTLSNNVAYDFGGAIGSVTPQEKMKIENCMISDNSARNGAGIYSYFVPAGTDTVMIIENSVISNNDVISNSAFDDEGHGGGIYCYITQANSNFNFIIRDSKIEGNTASDNGAGIYLYSYSSPLNVLIEDCFINENSTGKKGGGVYYNKRTNSSTPELLFKDVTFNNNEALYGGGMYFNVYRLENISILNSTISNNSAFKGGGFYGDNTTQTFTADILVKNSTIVGNNADSIGGAYYLDIFNNILQATLSSSIIAFNGDNSIYNSVEPLFISEGYNIFSDSLLLDTIASDQIATDSLSLNLGELSYNGGNTPTMMPNYPSIAIDNGNPLDLSDAQNTPIVGIREAGSAEYCMTTFSDQFETVCDSYTWMDGNSYTESTEVDYYLINSMGCDSVVTLYLTVNSNSSIDTVSTCDSYTWMDGITYTENNDSATFLLTNVAGCDSIIHLFLTINYSTLSVDSIIACDEYTWIDGITYQSSNNSSMITYNSSLGCDSIIQLNLVIHNTSFAVDSIEAIVDYTWIDGITYFESNDTSVFTLTNANGCDSVVSLHLTIDSVNVGLNIENELSKVAVYPNPSNGQITIDTDEIVNLTIRLYNLNGELLYQKKNLNGISNQIDIIEPAGIYILQLSTASTNRYLKLIIE